jgi:hypothetical protein
LPPGDSIAPGGDHHPARRLFDDGEDLRREGPAEAAAGFDRGGDDDQLGAVVVGDLRHLLPERALPRPHDHPPHADAVRVGDRSGMVEAFAELREVEVRVERQLLCDHERRDEHDARAAVGGQAAGEVDPVLRLGATEERDDDMAVADGSRAAREAAEAPPGR